ncbi:MAG: radical SAM family heme chaperone HemW, partial [Deltaproteobacteria bacterium]|nr:radical SAM family heme chaperone HemW [Deltaproteobacteria bacterium]
MSDTSVYIHFPYCARKCPYCDFASYAVKRIPQREYADAVLRELEARAPALEGRRLSSVFFGGGTPSLWSAPELGRVLAAVRGVFESEAPELEVTAECNPASFDQCVAAGLREAGVNRVSVGVQSFDDARLDYLGRLHDGAGALASLRAATEHFERVSGDLIFGTPGQVVEDVRREVDALVELGLEHVSAYALTIEPGTRFGELQRLGKLRVSPEETYAELYFAVEERLAQAGFEHYEVSNYARPGEASRHNQHYWRGGAYLGLGAAAVGCLDAGPGRARRWRNRVLPQRYLEHAGAPEVEESEEHLGPKEILEEAFMLGLRTAEGVDL